jgi:gas vesicle protein
MADESNSSIGWFLAGLGLGALVGVLFAPKPGSETREYIAHRANEGTDYLKQQSQAARGSVNDWIERGKEVVDRSKQQVQSAFEAGKQAYRETTSESAG